MKTKASMKFSRKFHFRRAKPAHGAVNTSFPMHAAAPFNAARAAASGISYGSGGALIGASIGGFVGSVIGAAVATVAGVAFGGLRNR